MNVIKELPISISPDYVGHWGNWEAIREIIQNAIDTKDFDVMESENDLIITSRGGKIPIKALLLGNSGKRDDSQSIGTYGEGLKLAMVVLLRNNKTISIKNGNDLWTPVFGYSELFEGESLNVIIEENVYPDNEDVVVAISGLNWKDFEQVWNNFIDLNRLNSEDIGAESSHGFALKQSTSRSYEEDAEEIEETYSRVFVNGLFICNIPGKYYYDYSFKPEYLTLDRDRNTIPQWEFQYETTKLLACSNHPAEIARLSVSEYEDVANYTKSGGSYFSSGISQEKSEAITQFATEGFIETHGKDAFPVNEKWTTGKKTLVSQKVALAGKKPVIVSNGLYEMISKNYKVEDKLQELFEFKPIEFLSNFIQKYGEGMNKDALEELNTTIENLQILKGV